MRVSVTGSGKSKSYYIIKSFRVNGKSTSKIIEKLGNEETVRKLAYPEDPYVWAKKRADELTRQEKENSQEIIVKYNTSKLINKDQQTRYNGGYLFLQDIYHKLTLNKICDKISQKYKFDFDLNQILSRLVYDRILFPRSKKAMFDHRQIYIEQSKFELHHVYRALEILAKEIYTIQAELYKQSKKVIQRNTQVLYYDCTNYFFEIETDDDFRKYGKSKEHRPTPLVQMGLFMDGSGLPLAFTMTPGNQNEQLTIKPLEQKIMKDFKETEFIVCTDAGLSSLSNRQFNNHGQRRFITTQSLKKLKKHLKSWALEEDGWTLPHSTKQYSLSEINDLNKSDLIFYKERWTNEDGLEQRLIISYSTKYRHYQQKIRQNQIDRASKLIKKGVSSTKSSPHDVKRFIKQVTVTSEGEITKHTYLELDEAQITKEAQYDGFYGVCTNADGLDVAQIININRGRWEIEESFRIMKSEFKARPVNLSIQARIEAHFLTCFIALLIFRILENKVDSFTSCHELLDTLRTMDFKSIRAEGLIPLYTRTNITDKLHETFDFRTDYEIISLKNLKNILKKTKM